MALALTGFAVADFYSYSSPWALLTGLMGVIYAHLIANASSGTSDSRYVSSVKEPNANAYRVLKAQKELADAFEQQGSVLQSELDRLHTLLSDATDKLQNAFRGTQEKIQEQLKHADRIMDSTATINQRSVSGVDEQEQSLTGQVNGLLQQLDESKNRTTDYNRRLAELLGVIERTIHRTVSELSEVNSIAKQTSLIAINTAIEAARAGEAGRSFSVVADQVMHLSSKTNTFSAVIASQISEVKQTIDSAHGVLRQFRLEENASDHSAADQAKQSLAKIDSLNVDMCHATEDMRSCSMGIEQETTSAVIALQFSDLARQLIEHIHKRADWLESSALSYRKLLSEGEGEYTEEEFLARIERLREDVLDHMSRLSHNPVMQHSLNTQDVELF